MVIRMKKPEPLKGKIRERIELIRERIIQIQEEGELGNFDKLLLKRALEQVEMLREDVKSAVQGLLEEIKDNRIDIEIEEDGVGTVFEPDGRFVRYETIISLIKKWLGGVLD